MLENKNPCDINKTIDNDSKKNRDFDVWELIINPSKMMSIKNVERNIKAYGDLEFYTGLLKEIELYDDYKELYEIMKLAISNKDYDYVLDIFNAMKNNNKNKEQDKCLNTLFVTMIHKINKDLNLYFK